MTSLTLIGLGGGGGADAVPLGFLNAAPKWLKRLN